MEDLSITIKDEYIKLGQALKLAGLVSSGEVDTRRGKKLRPGDTFEFENTVVLVK